MPWLTVRYSPGFQEDLTSWVLRISDDGHVRQEVYVHRFSPFEQFEETHRFLLSPAQMTQIEEAVALLDIDEILKVESQYVIDDAELVRITYNSDGKSLEFTSPMEHWLWRQSRGETLPASIKGALALWCQVQPLSQYKARHASGA